MQIEADVATPRATPRANPALWLVVGIPSATILASVATLWLAFGDAEPKLPSRYAWEGAALERDMARARQARALGIGATLVVAGDGHITVQLTPTGDATPRSSAPLDRSLRLHLTHATRPQADLSLTLTPSGTRGRFTGHAGPLPPARWLVQLEGDEGRWQLRGRVETPAGRIQLGY